MNVIRNILAVIGLLAILAGGYAYTQFGDMFGQVGELKNDIAALEELDPKAGEVYKAMWQKLKETGTSADATVVKYPLSEGVTPEDAEETMRFVANEHNIKSVGELPLSQQVELETGEKQRFLKIYQYCNPQTAMKMVAYSDAFSAYLPCRIALVEDKEGNYNLYSLNMDMMIYGGKTLPPELHAEAVRVQEIITDIMQRAATGDF
ncbi:MAG: DUF302 domain-containing protein [Thiolinea sp.]